MPNHFQFPENTLLLKQKMELKKAEKITKNLISFKKNLIKKKNVKELIINKKNELKKIYNISIDYLELRNKSNLQSSSKIKNSKIFIGRLPILGILVKNH